MKKPYYRFKVAIATADDNYNMKIVRNNKLPIISWNFQGRGKCFEDEIFT